MDPFRVSAISYLNTAPLMWSFENGKRKEELRKKFQISYTIPSLCAQALRDGSADIGIIPVAAYASIPDLVIIPDIAIAAKGPVRSILLISRKPLNRIKSVALDSSSRTSAALTRILFHQFYRSAPSFLEASPDLEQMLARADAALLIGDSALQVELSQYHTWDLAEEWQRFTGKPFVFAFWAVRRAAASEEQLQNISHVFQESRDAGLAHIPEVVKIWSPRTRLPEAIIEHYLTRNIHYHLEAEMIEGMRLFFAHAAECQALPHVPELEFIHAGQPATTGAPI
ncbi:MAG TPA: menaquinone biosynthesis protein [Terriglobales bacterium]